MIILAFDSTAKAASVALTDDERLLADFVCDNGLTHSEILLPMAEEALKRVNKTIDDVELFACNAGPGSFTGVRIGVSLVKGLSFGRGIPCAPVSTLHALAYNLFPLDGLYCPVMDARRGQVYNALFTVKDGKLVRLTEDRAITLGDLARELQTDYAGAAVRLTGDGAALTASAFADSGITLLPMPALLLRQNAYSTARAAKELYDNRETVSDAALSPFYLRLPQAERDRLERENRSGET